MILDAQVSSEEETVWLTQAQMAKSFGVNSQAITRHIQNIYNQDELDEISICSKMEQVEKGVLILAIILKTFADTNELENASVE